MNGDLSIASYPISGYEGSWLRRCSFPASRTSSQVVGSRRGRQDSTPAEPARWPRWRLVARFVPPEVFAPADAQRERIYTPWVTFISFLGQVLSQLSVAKRISRPVPKQNKPTNFAVGNHSPASARRSTATGLAFRRYPVSTDHSHRAPLRPARTSAKYPYYGARSIRRPSLFVFKRARRTAARHRRRSSATPANRLEPRARKRRPKNYQLLSKPRREMTVAHSRNLK